MQKYLFEQLECVCAWNECMKLHYVNEWEHEHGVNERKVTGVMSSSIGSRGEPNRSRQTESADMAITLKQVKSPKALTSKIIILSLNE